MSSAIPQRTRQLEASTKFPSSRTVNHPRWQIQVFFRSIQTHELTWTASSIRNQPSAPQTHVLCDCPNIDRRFALVQSSTTSVFAIRWSNRPVGARILRSIPVAAFLRLDLSSRARFWSISRGRESALGARAFHKTYPSVGHPQCEVQLLVCAAG